MNNPLLEKIGLTPGEIKVYFALLGLGDTTTGPIITKAQVASSKVYDILTKLIQKGLVSESIKSGTKHFQAASPDKIMDFIRQKEKEIQNEKNQFEKLLPQLKARQKFQEQKQEAKIYADIEGVKTYFADTLEQLKKGDEYLALTFADKALENKSIIATFQKFHQKRAQKGIFAKIIANENDKSAKDMDYSNTKLYEFRTTDQIIPTGIAIFKDSVATLNWGKTPRVFVIICKENAEQYKKFFYSTWSKSKTKPTSKTE